jgi:hypothetical protein
MEHEYLKDVSPEHHFKVKDGTVIRNLKELEFKLKAMSDSDFKHHVSDEKNDFAVWINDIVKDQGLADSLATITKKKEMIGVIEQRIKELKGVIAEEIGEAEKAEEEEKSGEEIEEVKKQEVKKKSKKHPKKAVVSEREEEIEEKVMETAEEVESKIGLIEKDAHELEHKRVLLAGFHDFLLGLLIGIMIGLILARILF